MKKINLIKLMSLIFVCAMLMGTIVLTAFAADEQDAVEIYSQNIEFGEKLQLVFAVKAAEGAQIEIEAKDANENDVAIVEATDKNGNHYTTVNSASKGPADCYLFKTANGFSLYDIDATVTVTVKVGEATDSVTYSVLEYLFEREAALTGELTAEQQKQKAMYAALRVFADATAQVVENAPAGKFDAYSYVTVIGGTIDGYDSTGIFANGSTPFGNLVPNIELEAGYKVAWVVNGDTENPKDPAEMKDVVVDGEMTIEAIPVEGECDHLYDEVVTEPDCQNSGFTTYTCTLCGDNYVDDVVDKKGHHVDNDADGSCDVCDTPVSAVATITFDNISKRTEFSTEKQVWAENGITFTNNKSKSTNVVADYSNPVRCYKNSTITIAFPAMTKIVIECDGTNYLGIAESNGVAINGTTITITLDGDNSYTTELTEGQMRIETITVYSSSCCVWDDGEITTSAGCETDGVKTYTCLACGATKTEAVKATGHVNTTTVIDPQPTCTETGIEKVVCACGEVVSTTTIPATGHNYENGECTVCHAEEPAAGTHTCESPCPVVGCGKCTDAECTEAACADKCPGHKSWEKLESGSLQVGDKIIIVCESKNMQLNGISTTSTKYGLGTAYSGTPAETYVLEVVAGVNSNTFAFKISGTNTYLNWSSGNSLNTASSVSANSSWTVTFSSGNAIIKNVNDAARQLQWNASSPRFACYGNSGQTAIQIYVYR